MDLLPATTGDGGAVSLLPAYLCLNHFFLRLLQVRCAVLNGLEIRHFQAVVPA